MRDDQLSIQQSGSEIQSSVN